MCWALKEVQYISIVGKHNDIKNFLMQAAHNTFAYHSTQMFIPLYGFDII